MVEYAFQEYICIYLFEFFENLPYKKYVTCNKKENLSFMLEILRSIYSLKFYDYLYIYITFTTTCFKISGPIYLIHLYISIIYARPIPSICKNYYSRYTVGNTSVS